MLPSSSPWVPPRPGEKLMRWQQLTKLSSPENQTSFGASQVAHGHLMRTSQDHETPTP